ncbi:MAG: Smr/MutS family protein [Desulfatiglandaceae bacterium]
MARKKKKRGRLKRQGPIKNPAGLFNPALDRSVSLGLKENAQSEGGKSNQDQGVQKPSCSEDDCFIEAMGDVVPLSGERGRVVRTPRRDLRPPYPPRNGDLEVMTHLSDLVSGAAEMDITFSDEYMEGAIPGMDRKLMEKLRNGQFPIQDHVDLHGLTQKEAEVGVRDFLLDCYRHGLRCVLVVHGRGLNSENHIPVLKTRVPVWLSRGPVKKIILAFSTAKAYDGGTGAIYVLLRRSGKAL